MSGAFCILQEELQQLATAVVFLVNSIIKQGAEEIYLAQ